jgi:hypothetical protein
VGGGEQTDRQCQGTEYLCNAEGQISTTYPPEVLPTLGMTLHAAGSGQTNFALHASVPNGEGAVKPFCQSVLP